MSSSLLSLPDELLAHIVDEALGEYSAKVYKQRQDTARALCLVNKRIGAIAQDKIVEAVHCSCKFGEDDPSPACSRDMHRKTRHLRLQYPQHKHLSLSPTFLPPFHAIRDLRLVEVYGVQLEQISKLPELRNLALHCVSYHTSAALIALRLSRLSLYYCVEDIDLDLLERLDDLTLELVDERESTKSWRRMDIASTTLEKVLFDCVWYELQMLEDDITEPRHVRIYDIEGTHGEGHVDYLVACCRDLASRVFAIFPNLCTLYLPRALDISFVAHDRDTTGLIRDLASTCGAAGIEVVFEHDDEDLGAGAFAAIAIAPASAPSSLISNLIQANAYAVSLLGYLLSNSSGLAASPPWAVTGQKSPEERKEEAQQMVLDVLGEMEAGGSSSEKHSLRRRGRISRKHLARVIDENPSLVLDLGASRPPCCGIPGSHWMLYIGFGVSVVIWMAALYLGVLGGVTGATKVALSQPNCTEGLGQAAALILYADIGFMMLGIVLFIATIINHLANVAGALNRDVITEYNGSPKLVFGVSFLIWLVWMVVSFSIYFIAANHNLLAAGEFSWSFGSTFSALMIIIPVYSIIKAAWSQR
ncbi:hypothetical protein JCM10450v2_003665 [Rhodotorula kratochvilovae]